MNSENKTNNGKKQGEVRSTPAVSSRVVTYKKTATLKKNEAPAVTVGKVKKVQVGVRVNAPKTTQVGKDQPKTTAATTGAVKGQSQGETKANPTPKVLNKHKKKRIKQGAKPIKVIIGVLVAFALIIGGVILGLYSSGHRYDTVKFTDAVTAEKYTIVFIGTVDANGTPVSGTIKYPQGQSATLSRNEDNIIRVEYSGGDVYEGDFKDLHRNGYGTLTMKNGDVYTGNFFYDRMWGKGEYRYSNGDVYTGEFQNNVKSGDGVYSFANGNLYEGKMENDMLNGEGIFKYASGNIYEGNFTNGIKNDDNAKMTIALQNGGFDVYIGEFKNDRRDGMGTYTFACGDTYEGQFSMDCISGHGKYTWVSGRTYEGQFLNGAIVKDSSLYPQV
jgi:hypothetical protein